MAVKKNPYFENACLILPNDTTNSQGQGLLLLLFVSPICLDQCLEQMGSISSYPLNAAQDRLFNKI